MTFQTKLHNAFTDSQSRLCVGLDPDPDRLPDHLRGKPDPVLGFLREIVAATRDLACAFKPNFAFYGAMGAEGWGILRGVLKAIPDSLPTILDFKAGDIGNTAQQYARMAYDLLGVDAVTVNPLMGLDAVEPFLRDENHCAFLLCLTSNPSSTDFQRLVVEGEPLYRQIARKAVSWASTAPCGLVVGATHPEELQTVRALAPDLPFLIPGVGTQGGDARAVVQMAVDASGEGAIVNASRSILYASRGNDFAEAARHAAESLRRELD